MTVDIAQLCMLAALGQAVAVQHIVADRALRRCVRAGAVVPVLLNLSLMLFWWLLDPRTDGHADAQWFGDRRSW